MKEREMTISEAARMLGLSVDAIKKRIKRGRIKAFKDDKGRWMVVLSDRDFYGTSHRDKMSWRLARELIAEKDMEIKALREEIEFLRKELELKNELIFKMQGMISQLMEGLRKGPWWKRIFG